MAPQKGKGKGKVSPTVGGRVTKTKKTKERKLQPESEDEHPEEEDQTYNLESLLDDNEDQVRILQFFILNIAHSSFRTRSNLLPWHKQRWALLVLERF